MACGCPIIVSNASSLPEIVGTGGIFFDPTDSDELMQQARKVLTDEALQGELGKRGLERSYRFSWEATARRTLQIYKELLLEIRPGGQ